MKPGILQFMELQLDATEQLNSRSGYTSGSEWKAHSSLRGQEDSGISRSRWKNLLGEMEIIKFHSLQKASWEKGLASTAKAICPVVAYVIP